MKHFFAAGALLLVFTIFALSFCMLRFWIIDIDDIAPLTVHYQEAEDAPIGKLHISLSAEAAETVTDVLGTMRKAARGLPFFVTDAAEFLGEETIEVFRLFNELICTAQKEGATLV